MAVEVWRAVVEAWRPGGYKRRKSGSRGQQRTTNMPKQQIFIKNMAGDVKTYEVEDTDTVAQLKQKIHDKDGVPPTQQRLVFNGKELDDDKSMADYQMEEHSTVHLVL